jgi:hypothetical protein
MSDLARRITAQSLNGLDPIFPMKVTYQTREQLENYIAETIKRAASEIDIRDLIENTCGEWAVKTPVGFATSLQNEIAAALRGET